MATYLDQALTQLKQFEGCIPWMYRDTRGFITVGVGLMLPDHTAAAGLPFSKAGAPATVAQIQAEFARVMALAMGHPAPFYCCPDKLELAQATIDAKLLGVVTGFEARLRAGLPGYDAMPAPAKMALIDMVYNLGPDKLFSGYPHFIQFVRVSNWTAAAAGCHRTGPSDARNNWTRNQFLLAAAQVHSGAVSPAVAANA